MIRDVHIGIEAIRNSMDVIFAFTGEWIVVSLVPSAPWAVNEEELWREVWVSLGIGTQLVDVFVNVLQLRFSDGSLRISTKAFEMTDAVGKVQTALLAAWNFKKCQ